MPSPPAGCSADVTRDIQERMSARCHNVSIHLRVSGPTSCDSIPCALDLSILLTEALLPVMVVSNAPDSQCNILIVLQ